MAEPQKTAVSTVAILAIVILVALVFYFVWEESNDDVEIDFNLDGNRSVPTQVHRAAVTTPDVLPEPAGIGFDAQALRPSA